MSPNHSGLSADCQICTVCNVAIDAEEAVHFSHGPAGTRERLYARVCRFTHDAACLNKGERQISARDCYGRADELIQLPPSPPISLGGRAA